MKSGKRLLTSLMVAVMLSSINIVYGAEHTTVNEGETLNIHELTLENLNYSGNGGAIYSSNGDLTVNNSNFNNNNIELVSVGNLPFASANGGAIYNNGNLTVSNSSFDGNKAILYEKKSNEDMNMTINGGHGGAIYNENGAITVNNSVFKNNSAGNSGGAIESYGELNINDSKFYNNSVYDNYNGSGGAINARNLNIKNTEFDNNSATVYGGAIQAFGYEMNTVINNSKFTNNRAEEGGAIFSANSITIENSSFNNNSAVNDGGAINSHSSYTNIKITDTDFKNNTAKRGGALSAGNEYYTPESGQEKTKVDISAVNKDVVFSGNKAEKGADIYIANTDLNLNANENRIISFDGGITGKNSIININEGTSGHVIFANSIAPDENSTLGVNVKNGTLTLTNDNYLNNTDLSLAENSTLNLINNTAGTLNFNSLTSNNAKLNIDMDLSNAEQYFDYISAKTASGNLDLSEINLLSDMKNDTNKISVNLSKIGLPDTITMNTSAGGINTLTNDYLYTIIADGTKVEINRMTDESGNTAVIDGFTIAVNQTDKIGTTDVALSENRIYSATKDIEITGQNSEKGWTGALGGKSLTVNGNGYNLNGSDKTGLQIDNGQTLSLNDTNVTGFKTSDDRKGALTVKDGGTLNISAINNNVSLETTNTDENNNIIYLDGTTSKAFLNTENGKEITLKSDVRSADKANELNLKGNGKITFNGIVDPLTLTNENANTVHNNYVDDVTYNLNSGTVTFSKDEYLNGQTNKNTLNFNGGTLNLANGAVGVVDLAALNINANSNIMLDADLAKESMDRITADNATANKDAYLNVSNINLLSDATKDKVEINSVDPAITLDSGETLASRISTSVIDVAFSPIYKYGVGYDPTTGNFTFSRGSNKDYNNINPAVMVSPVAAQLGGYMTMLDTYNNAFTNMDMRMLSPSSIRLSNRDANKYAVTELSASQNLYKANEYNSRGLYVRPYAGYDSVGLKNGPKVGNVSYGSFIGGDTEVHTFKNGYEGTFSPFISYQGSHQSYSGNSIYQNGGSLGFTGTLYKGNFFTGLTVGAGMNISEANTMYGSEDFPMLTAGIANKTGYNFEFKDGRFIIQPNLLLSYTFVNAFDYTNGAGIKVNSDPLHAIQVAPSVKFVMNTRNGWQPYASFGMMWNIMDDTNFTANNVSLPELSIKPYFQYGLGVQKLIGDRFTAYGQVMLRNGGRNGIAATFGGRYMLGKEKSHNENI